ncbi:hypothetical protein HDV03_004795 [Kappamyces sp. JEL0829]|nr:hypothetical protein HDV03_004795 [Kappamyces sp. JEL0829]
MFGLICAGRLVQTDITQVDTQRYIFQIQDAPTVNHLVVFLLGHTPFPPGYGATVHFLWPSASQPAWVFLGILTNDKPSAIFKLGGSKSASSGYSKSMDDLMEEDKNPFQGSGAICRNSNSVVDTVAQLGISIEPIATVMQAHQTFIQSKNQGQLTTVRSAAESPASLTMKILESTMAGN